MRRLPGMSTSPKPATAPKLSPLQVDLQRVELVDAQRFGDDELVSDLSCARLEVSGLRSEFIELSQLLAEGGSLAGSHWRRTNWVDVSISHADGANAVFDESGLHRTSFTACRLTGLGLPGCTAQDVTFTECRLDLANFRFANLKRVSFIGCDLRGADFSNAMLNDVTFTNCTLDEAVFDKARSERVLLDGGSIVDVRGLEGLRGAQVRSDRVLDLARSMAQALGLELVD